MNNYFLLFKFLVVYVKFCNPFKYIYEIYDIEEKFEVYLSFSSPGHIWNQKLL